MESYTLEESVNNDFLSQSYSQGVERITGTNHFNLNFEIPEDVLKVRQKTWKYLFDKYSEEASNDVPINIITYEPEIEVSEEEYSCKQRIRMCKPASMIQYWINTGNPPYEAFLNEENEDIGSSLNEEEIESVSLKQSLFLSNKNNKQECQNQLSSSSVDTAVYILSNANVTKKTDAMAIIEGAKCLKSSKNVKDIKTISNDKTEYIRNARIDQCDYSDNNVNINGQNTEISPTKHVDSQVHTQEPSAGMSTNTLQFNNSQYLSCEKTDKMNTSKSNPKRLDIRNIHDIAYIFQQFDKTLKRLSDKEDTTSDQNKVNIDISNVRKASAGTIATETTENNQTMLSQRKKLYTGRDSPIDLMLMNRHSIHRLSEVNHHLHPALETNDCMIARKSFLKHKNKRSLLSKKSLNVEKKGNKRKRKSTKLIENKIDNDNKNSITSSSQSLSKFHNNLDEQDDIPLCRKIVKQKNSDINSSANDEILSCKSTKLIENKRDNDNKNSATSSQSLSNFHNNLNEQDDIPLCRKIVKQKNSDINSSANNGLSCKQASLNLNPVVFLERITPYFTGCDFNFVKNNQNAQENNTNNKPYFETRILCDSKIQNVDLESRRSSTSTIVICKCRKDTSREEESNDSSFNLQLSIDDDDHSAMNVKKKVDKLLSSEDMIQTKVPCVLIERLPLLSNENINTTATSQVLSKIDDIQQKQVLDKSKMHGTNKIGDINLKEIQVSLARINTNCMNTTVKSQISNKNDAIQQKRVLRESEAGFSNSYKTNKDNIKLREVKVVLERLPANIHLKRNITNVNLYPGTKKISQNISLHNDKIESSIKTKSLANKNTEIFGKIKRHKTNNYSSRMRIKSNKNKLSDTSDIVSEHENQVSDKVESNSAYKCSILNLISSDEDDFVTLFQQSNKRFKRSFASIDKTLNEVNTINNKNLNTVIFSSKNLTPRKIDNSVVQNLSERNRRVRSVINTNKNRHLDTTIKRNEIDCRNNPNIIFQGRICHTDSSYSEESNSHTTSHKPLKGSSMYNKSRYFNRIKGRVFNGSIENRYITNSSNSSNSFIEEYNIKKQSHNKLLRLTSSKNIQISKQLANEEFNNISSSSLESLRSINNTKKNSKSPFLTNNKQDTSVEKESFVKTFFGKNNFSNISENTQKPDKFKSSVATQQSSIKPTVTKSLRFVTKTYYDSGSSTSS